MKRFIRMKRFYKNYVHPLKGKRKTYKIKRINEREFAMSEINENENRAVMNEYLEVSVKRDLVQLCSDCYRALGWTIINASTGIDSVILKLKRERKIKNRVGLCDLQRKCEEAFRTIEKLENSKTNKAMTVSLGVGIIGTVFMTGSVFAYLAAMLPLSILLAVPAFIGWGLPYFLFKKLLRDNIDKITPMIDRNYDVIYGACEKASQLLS
jgi:hypothetical protein